MFALVYYNVFSPEKSETELINWYIGRVWYFHKDLEYWWDFGTNKQTYQYWIIDIVNSHTQNIANRDYSILNENYLLYTTLLYFVQSGNIYNFDCLKTGIDHVFWQCKISVKIICG